MDVPEVKEKGDGAAVAALLPANEELRKLLGPDPVKSLLQIASGRGIANYQFDAPPGPPPVTERGRHLLEVAAQVARDWAEHGRDIALTEEQQEAVQAFVFLIGRPSLLVRRGGLPAAPTNWRRLDQESATISRQLRAVGRIDSFDGTRLATGWFGGSNRRRILTNNHVVCALLGRHPMWWKTNPTAFEEAKRLANEKWRVDPASRPTWDRLGEVGNPERLATQIASIAGTHADVDMAALELAEPVPDDVDPLVVSATPPAAVPGQPIYAIGFPIADRQGTPAFRMSQIFEQVDALGYKRVSPGYVIQHPGAVFAHDGSTLAGSSGSAVIDFETNRVIGLHFRGPNDEFNEAVPLFRFRGDPLLVESEILFEE